MSANKKSQTMVSYDKDGNVDEVKDIDVYSKITKRHFKKGEFFMVHMSFPETLLKKQYTGLTYRVLMALQMRIDFNNRIKGFRQSDLAKQLGTSQANISRALVILEKDKIIRRDSVDYYFCDSYIKGAGYSKSEDSKNQDETEESNELQQSNVFDFPKSNK